MTHLLIKDRKYSVNATSASYLQKCLILKAIKPLKQVFSCVILICIMHRCILLFNIQLKRHLLWCHSLLIRRFITICQQKAFKKIGGVIFVRLSVNLMRVIFKVKPLLTHNCTIQTVQIGAVHQVESGGPSDFEQEISCSCSFCLEDQIGVEAQK